jgi:hypothetical protein
MAVGPGGLCEGSGLPGRLPPGTHYTDGAGNTDGMIALPR